MNLPPELVQYAREEARRVGISERLMLMILWQEQQWYQNVDSGNGAASGFGHFFNWVLRKTIKSDKSLGITHMKLGTLRDLIRTHHLIADQGRDLNSYSDDELAKTLEVNEKLSFPYPPPPGVQTGAEIADTTPPPSPPQRPTAAPPGRDPTPPPRPR